MYERLSHCVTESLPLTFCAGLSLDPAAKWEIPAGEALVSISDPPYCVHLRKCLSSDFDVYLWKETRTKKYKMTSVFIVLLCYLSERHF